uniref:Receptor expression-enhancing protein n=1 Tax=Lotharella oceanica TaxID=641309 RepID=A0A7S2U0Q7_9EUKA|mmetsp:Transcript_37149/g.68563  ORF Transcript_37149/g.68563 Transcript_37149/m.68563 type:complete len:237 (+) Transcript_37149:72-782(+)|eukprot:CAMPEP_0170170830 /NCGR_PEP_ID=MMETSP0040_2-20121228/3877_1 /TAXON_ID=641309 /ORGANISM="Lotharella oceanica, Strain CCMP622" /LENGTH=236 /DNA_ID=CAMNT_0010410499 /DNA_START=72 /DNA_END=782 /DNA_ORIENTATION=-
MAEESKAVAFPKDELLETVYNATGIAPLYLLVGLGIVAGALLINTFGFGAFGRCFSFAYLVYNTFKVKEMHNENIRTADKIHWLSHWAFYGTWTVFDFTTDIFFFWIPYVDAFKLVFLIWCLLPQTRGAQQVYYLFIHRGFQTHEEEIDGYIGSVRASMSQVMTEIGQLGLEFVMELLGSMGINLYQVVWSLVMKAAVAQQEHLQQPKHHHRRQNSAAASLEPIEELDEAHKPHSS